MRDLYEETSLSKEKVAKKTGFLDWNMQPSIFKAYPDSLFSYPLSTTPQLRALYLARCVTSEHLLAGKAYKRLSTPSAGNLHPLEIYVQIRGIKGILSGIYHVNSDKDTLVLIRDIEADGVEEYVDLEQRFKGMIVMFSLVPFRSIWKYQQRAFRYCYLDLGHQLANFHAACIAEEQELTFLSEFDAFGLSKIMGMDEQEQIVSTVLLGKETEKNVQMFSSSLMRVQPTDYYEQAAIQEVILKSYQAFDTPIADAVLRSVENLDNLILTRRSAREFFLTEIKKESLEYIMHLLLQLPETIQCHLILMRGEGFKSGLYQGVTLKREGVFINKMVDLLINQQFILNASVVLVFSSPTYNVKLLMQSAYFTHILSLTLRAMNIGLSGIGAFYDKDLQEFLETKDSILYTVAVGNI